MRKYRPFVDAAVNGSNRIPMRRSDIGSPLFLRCSSSERAPAWLYRDPRCDQRRGDRLYTAPAPKSGRLRGRPTASTMRGCLGSARMRRPLESYSDVILRLASEG
jgi:hypothetical protein